MKFATFQYDGKAVFHLKEQDGIFQLDEIIFNSLDANNLDEYSLLPISVYFAQPINEEIIKIFNQSKQFSDFMKAIGLKEDDITEKSFFSGELNDNLMGILRIAKEVDSYTDYSTDDLMSFLKVANNNQNISPSYQFTLSIVMSNLTIDSTQLEKIAEKNKFPKGSYLFEFLDKDVIFEIE